MGLAVKSRIPEWGKAASGASGEEKEKKREKEKYKKSKVGMEESS